MSNEEVKSIKIQCPGCGRKLDVTELEPFSVHPCPSCGMKFKIPKWFLNILLEDEIEKSDSKAVYRALEPALDRESCVKIIKTGDKYTSKETEDLIEAARRQALIIHSNIAAIFACGTTDDGAYVISQYAGKKNWPQAPLHDNSGFCQFAIDLLTAFEAADKNGLIHGNITPDNVLFNSEGGLLVTDFGTAAALKTPPGANASPERLSGASPSRSGDIFSLGIWLYKLATDEFPCKELDGDWRKEGVKPKPVCELNLDIPRQTSDIVMKMLSLDPSNRPSSYSDLIRQFKEVKSKKTLRTNSPRPFPSPARSTYKGDESTIIVGSDHSVSFINVLLLVCVCVAVLLGIVYWRMNQPAAKTSKDNNQKKSAGTELQLDVKDSANGMKMAYSIPNSLGIPQDCLDARPRPDDLNFKAVKEKTQKYITMLPANLKEIEKDRLRIIGSCLDNLTMSMKAIPYTRGENAIIHMKGGKTVLGCIPYAPKDGIILIRPSNGGDSNKYKFADLEIAQILDIFLFYAEKREEMAAGKILRRDVKDGLFDAYMELALLADWYEKPENIVKYTDLALKFRPSRRTELQRFGLPVKPLLQANSSD